MKVKIGLALGSGGARGLAHVGVLKVLEQEQIPIDCIAGTSMGAIIGAMYAQHPDTTVLIQCLEEFFTSQDYESLGLKYIVPKNDQMPSFLGHFTQVVAQRIVVNIAQSRTGIIKRDRLQDAIAFLIEDERIENLRIPFAAVASDLHSGETVMFREGSVREAVQISASIPGFLAPHDRDGQLLTDGGVSAPVPTEEVRQLGANFTIGVCVDANEIKALQEPNIIDIITRVNQIKGKYLSRFEIAQADIGLHPLIENAHWSELLRYKEFITAGEVETRRKLPAIKAALKRRQGWLARLFNTG